MLDEPRARNNGKLTAPAAARGKAVAEARAARTLERAKAPHFAPTALPRAPKPANGPPNFRTLDRLSRALLARSTQGISPLAVAQTWTDWAVHLASAPGKRLELFQRAAMSMARFAVWAPGAAAGTNRDPLVEHRSDRQAIFRSGLVAVAVPSAHAELSLDRGLVGRGDDGMCRDSRATTRPEVAFMTRAMIDVVSPSNIPWLNPVDRQCDGEGRRPESRSRRGQLARRPRPLAFRQAARGRGDIRGRAQRRGHAGQGRLSQRSHGADPVRADDGQGVPGADPDHSGLDHEILHPRPRARELAGALARRARPHRVHRVVEEPRRARPRRESRRLPPPGRDGRARRGLGDRAGPEDPRLRLLPRRHDPGDRGGDDGEGPRRPHREPDPARVPDRLRGSRRDHAVPRRASGDAARRPDVGPGLSGQPADGGRLPGAALGRTHLVASSSANMCLASATR